MAWKTLNRRRVILLFALAAIAVIVWQYGYPWWVERRQESYFTQCSHAQRYRRWEELQQLSEEWTQWQPHSAEAWLFRADAAQKQGDFAAAADCLSAIPETSPKALPAYAGLATLQFGSANRPLDGVRTAERILELEPRTTVAHQQLIEFYAVTLQRAKLLDQIRYAIELEREPRSAYIYLFLIDTMRLANGVEANDKWLESHPDNEVFLVARGLQLPEPATGDDPTLGNKHKVIEKLFERFPNNIELLAYQTDLAIRVGNTNDVAKLLLSLPAEADDDNRFWRAKGWLHLNRNEFPAAKEALLYALELHPLDWSARNWLADLVRRQGELDTAQELEKIVRQARQLREMCTGSHAEKIVELEVLTELAEHARQCGDKLLADSLASRLAQLGGNANRSLARP